MPEKRVVLLGLCFGASCATSSAYFVHDVVLQFGATIVHCYSVVLFERSLILYSSNFVVGRPKQY